MPRKKSDARDARGVKRDKKTSQLLERGETPRADERLDPRAESPGDTTDGGAPANDASYDLNRGEGSSTRAARPRRKSDDSLAREIHEILTADPELDATDIGVEVEGGAVTLSGEVVHPDAKLLAEELTESVAGVRLVHNRLVVRR